MTYIISDTKKRCNKLYACAIKIRKKHRADTKPGLW